MGAGKSHLDRIDREEELIRGHIYMYINYYSGNGNGQIISWRLTQYKFSFNLCSCNIGISCQVKKCNFHCY